MRPSKRFHVVHRVAEDHEQQGAARLAACERRVRECEAKLAELEGYQASYISEFSRHAGRGMGGARLREFQAFLSRLAEAVRQQKDIVLRSQAERDAARSQWQRASQRSEIVGRVVKRKEHEEQRALEHDEQREADERAQRKSTRRLDAGSV